MGEGLRKSRTDWKRIDRLSDADIAQAIKNDPGTFAPGEEWIRRTGVLRPTQPKQRLTVRFDADMVNWFKRQGRGYQTRMNAILRAYFEHTKTKS